ncbi:LysM peptidoglycan-binding domain-containing protein [Bryobacter aggregatus]|uniref:LysM peptidoglycan-binding domain-containing protein n=1 Tax=Bryobacter aggregatus TaxID=360054 RepID=UPI0004E19AF8|nr:LysM peptidoglycan-binding domain-containing protein [Bryobacter aggregatus]
MDLLEGLKLKYQSVLNVVKSKGVVLSNLHVEGDKLFIKGAAPSEDIKNDVWNAIKAVNSDWSNEVMCDISVDTSLPQPTRTYTVVAGDSLWKIANQFYGNGAQYPKIIQGNPSSLKDEKSVIHPGDVLVIPD